MSIQDSPYLKHILDAINDIEESIGNKTKEEFIKDKDTKDATVRRLEIIGEATKNISSALKRKYPNVEWKKIGGARDVMIHAYFSVDLNIVWSIAKNDIPKLKKQVQDILENEE